jgi:hypothetical protein
MDNDVITHLIEIKSTLSAQDVKLDKLESAVLGNGQPGLMQKVEDLQSAKNWTWGAGSAITFLLGMLETLLHLGKHRQ